MYQTTANEGQNKADQHLHHVSESPEENTPKSHSAAGPDGISPKILQQCEDRLAPVLAMIYRKSVNEGQVPMEWRTATVIPIFKKGSKSAAGNY